MMETNGNGMPNAACSGNAFNRNPWNDGMPAKAGWGCMGCAVGMLLGMILLIGGIVLGLYTLCSSGDNDDSEFSTNAADDPKNLEEEYISGKRSSGDQPKIAVVDVFGIIVSSDNSINSSGIADPKLICTKIRRAASDSKVKALIVNLNTPGGEVVASDEIYAEIKRFRQTGKPAVAMLNTMAASGGYYVAAACHPIVAHKLTMTGSIGVIISTINYRGLFDKIGLQSEVYTSGKMKDMLNGGRARTPEEIRIVKEMVDRTYLEFSRIVAESRKIPVEKVRTDLRRRTGAETRTGRFARVFPRCRGGRGQSRQAQTGILYRRPLQGIVQFRAAGLHAFRPELRTADESVAFRSPGDPADRAPARRALFPAGQFLKCPTSDAGC